MGAEFKHAARVVGRTLPYIAFRLGVYALVWLAVLVYVGVVGLIGQVFSPWAFWALVVGSAYGIIRLRRNGELMAILVDVLKARHLTLIAEYVQPGFAPAGLEQVSWAERRLAQRFGDMAAFRVLRKSVRAVLGEVRDTEEVRPAFASQVLSALPVTSTCVSDTAMAHLTDVVTVATSRVDSPAPGAVAAVELTNEARQWSGMLSCATRDVLASWAATAAMALLNLLPLAIIAAFATNAWFEFMLFLTAVYAAFAVKWSLFDPIAVANTYLESRDPIARGDAPCDTEWDERLSATSEAYRELRGDDGPDTEEE